MNAPTKRLLVLGITLCLFYACSKDKKSSAVLPQITTEPITNITTNSATAAGIITNNGGGTVSASGICWSATNNLPTINDDTVKTNTTIGLFRVNLVNLENDHPYFVRAYAINEAGVAYGQTINFTTVNAPPYIANITFGTNLAVGQATRVFYNYLDAENDPENGTTFQWHITTDTVNGTITAIPNAIQRFYTPALADANKFLRVRITPYAASGTSPGVAANSFWTARIPQQAEETVNHVYNGQAVQYRTITSAVTGRKWLDRNLGAPNGAADYVDWVNMGDLFQWGRRDDGHQLLIRGATSASTIPVNGFTDVRVVTDVVGHNRFIFADNEPFNWRDPGNDNLWQMPTNVNNVCPTGFHVPTVAEWQAENLGGFQQAYDQLKITAGGTRQTLNASIVNTQVEGFYWTSTRAAGTYLATAFIVRQTGPAFSANIVRANGNMVRCIKD